MPETMDFAQAAKQAQSMKNQFRASETLEAVLTAAAQAIQATNEAKRQLRLLDDEIGECTRKQTAAEQVVVKIRAEAETEKQQAGQAAAATLKAEQAKLVPLRDELADAEADLARRRAASTETIDALEAREAAARKKTEAAEAKWAALRKSVAA